MSVFPYFIVMIHMQNKWFILQIFWSVFLRGIEPHDVCRSINDIQSSMWICLLKTDSFTNVECLNLCCPRFQHKEGPINILTMHLTQNSYLMKGLTIILDQHFRMRGLRLILQNIYMLIKRIIGKSHVKFQILNFNQESNVPA